MKRKISSHQDLEVYRRASGIAMAIFNESRSFPKEEIYSLTDQIRRSSRSVCANLAEAWRKRRYSAAFQSKLSDAEAETAETQVWVEFAVKCGYLRREVGAKFYRGYDRVLATIVGMINHPDSWTLPGRTTKRDRSSSALSPFHPFTLSLPTMSADLFQLARRVALVTGGSKGIGKAMARGFAEAGANVVISSRHQDELERAALDIGSGLKIRVATVLADMTKRDDVRRLADEATQAFGKLDILVNNAGTNLPQMLESIQDDDWDRILELNLTSCMALTRYVVPQMKERRWGRIIFLASVMGIASLAGRGPYSATKSGIMGFCRAIALELGEFGITANCLAPGPILTDLPRKTLNDEQRGLVAKRVPLGRWGDPKELAGPALLLASDAGSYISGTTLVVDGGILARTF